MRISAVINSPLAKVFRSRTVEQKRFLKELTLDKLDFLYRLAAGKLHLPPYTLRSLVGGARGFEDVGPWFLREFKRLEFIQPQSRLLEIGCGCGRLAFSFCRDAELRAQQVTYAGMDVDKKSILWCQSHISSDNPNFSFYHADVRNGFYNRHGKSEAKNYVFPHEDNSFDFIILTSVFTHLMEDDMKHYLAELYRLLRPNGYIYASFFTYRTPDEAMRGVARHLYTFADFHGHVAFHAKDVSERAVAYEERYLLNLVRSNNLILRELMYGAQDALILTKA